MKNWLLLAALFLTFGVCASTQTQQPKKKKLLFIGEVKGFEHDSVSHAMATIEKRDSRPACGIPSCAPIPN